MLPAIVAKEPQFASVKEEALQLPERFRLAVCVGERRLERRDAH
jgi:hypothetical protein